MSNPENLIRPAVLPQGSNRSPNSQISLDELSTLISNIATEIFTRQGPQLIQETLNPNAGPNIVRDQEIEERFRNNLGDLDKIPDIVKCLREFSGNQSEFNSWKKSVERVLQIYDSTKGTPRYYGILNTIRNKIVGEADIALESYNTPLDWTAISRCLSLHYADKRDLASLEYQMTSLVQGRSSVQDFYQRVYKHLSLILNKLGTLNASNESVCLLTQTYRDKALDTFIRGLNGDLPKLLGMREPVDLPQALHLCLKLENQTFRANYAHGNNFSRSRYNLQNQSTRNHNPNQFNRNPQLPPRSRPMTFFPQLAHNPQMTRENFHFNNPQQRFAPDRRFDFQSQPPPRPQNPKPQPTPEPMEVDESLRTRRIDYMNRPRPNYTRDRPPSSVNQPQRKIARNFHLDAEYQQYEAKLQKSDEEEQQTLDDYLDSTQDPQMLENQYIDFNDIHFLGN